MPEEKKEHTGPTINVRVKRNDHWEHVEVDKLTEAELVEVLKESPAEQRALLNAALKHLA